MLCIFLAEFTSMLVTNRFLLCKWEAMIAPVESVDGWVPVSSCSPVTRTTSRRFATIDKRIPICCHQNCLAYNDNTHNVREPMSVDLLLLNRTVSFISTEPFRSIPFEGSCLCTLNNRPPFVSEFNSWLPKSSGTNGWLNVRCGYNFCNSSRTKNQRHWLTVRPAGYR
jgi:hypothetical protein